MINKGINTQELFCSNIFEYEYEADEWPSSHTCEHKVIRPYNGFLFKLRQHYSDDVFPDFPVVVGKAARNSMMFKIVYRVNLLGTIQKEDNKSLIEVLATQTDYEQMDIFNAECIKNYVDYKWVTYGANLHYSGFFLHLVYMLSLFLFI